MARPVKASSVAPERIEFLPVLGGSRIPRGMLTTIAGRPDQGKGLLATHIAAEVSAAGGNVLYSAAEDSHGAMTAPRLQAAGADMDRIWLWRFQLPRDMPEVTEIVHEEQIDLIIMDPWASHLTSGANRFGDSVRTVTGPLTELVEQTMSSVIIIEHALKNPPKSGHPLDAIGGNSSGLPAASRAAYVLGKDPDDEDKRILANAKFNIGVTPKALSFELDTDDIEEVGEVPFLIPDDELIAFDPMKLFRHNPPGQRAAHRPNDRRAAACEWLTTYLADAGKPIKAATIYEDAKQHGMTSKTLRRAADDMEVVKNPPGGGRACTWDLPDDVKELMEISTDAPDEDDTSDLDAGLAALLGGDDEGDA